MLAGPTQEPGVAVLGLATSLEPGELALDVPGEIQPRVRERRAHAGEPLLHEGPQEGVALASNFDGTRHAPGRCRGHARERCRLAFRRRVTDVRMPSKLVCVEA
jgi:hypothetical protein